MSRKRIAAWVTILAVGMTARIAVAAPRAALAELRAAICCAERCPDDAAPVLPTRCCNVESAATDPAGVAVPPALDPPAPAVLALVPQAVALAPAPAVRRLQQLPPRAGPPGHPDTLKLRC